MIKETNQDETRRKKILQTAERLKSDFAAKQRELISIARRLAVLKKAFEEFYSERKVVSVRTEPAIFLLVQAEEDSPLYDIYQASDGKFHLKIYKAFEMEAQGHAKIVAGRNRMVKLPALRTFLKNEFIKSTLIKPYHRSWTN